MAFDYPRVIDWLDERIVNRPKRVVLVFLVLTAVFTAGLGSVSTESGNEQFAEDVPEQAALDAVNREFEPAFGSGTTSTQLVQTGENVLDQRGLVRMLTLQYRLERRTDLRIVGITSSATIVARTLDPNATTAEAQRRAVERASDTQIDAAVRTAATQNPAFTSLLSEDFNPQAASANSGIAVVEHAIPELAADEQPAGTNPLTSIQREMQSVTASVGGDIRVFGAGIIEAEFESVIGDTLIIVVPAAAILIVVFLIVAYRDFADLLLGVVALVMAILWTFGFMGFVGIAFNQILIAVPPLLLAVGIDFGIHAVNRYREERQVITESEAERAADTDADADTGTDVDTDTDTDANTDEDDLVGTSMRRATDQLLVAFFVVTATSVIGFASNFTSQLVPIRDFAVVASVGIVFTALIFGVFLPAAKVLLDRARERYPIPTFSQSPLGSERSSLGAVLSSGVVVARRAPVAFLLGVVILTTATGGYATGVDTTFSDEQFLPPEETPDYLERLPEPFNPNTYTVARDINFLESNFETGEDETVVVYVEAPMERDTALEVIHRAGDNPPDTFVAEDGRASEESLVTVVRALAAVDSEFRELVARNDRNANGVPDGNLDAIYDALMDSRYESLAGQYLTDERRSTRVVYAVEADASAEEVTEDARRVADRYRYEATATGTIVVFQAVADLIFESAIVSLAVALVGTAIFLVGAYGVLVGRPSLGLANLVPIVVTVAALAATMRYVGIALNAFTATVLAITIGLGIDYSVHVVHRFVDELDAHAELDVRDRLDALDEFDDGSSPVDAVGALERTVTGTGGALTGSVLTTVAGIGVLVLAVFPAIGQFGLLTALSVFYAYLASLVVLPSVLVVWARLVGERRSVSNATDETDDGAAAPNGAE